MAGGGRAAHWTVRQRRTGRVPRPLHIGASSPGKIKTRSTGDCDCDARAAREQIQTARWPRSYASTPHALARPPACGRSSTCCRHRVPSSCNHHDGISELQGMGNLVNGCVILIFMVIFAQTGKSLEPTPSRNIIMLQVGGRQARRT